MIRKLCFGLGWLMMALAVWGLFRLAADLPANGYELRFQQPISARQAESLRQAAGERELDLALWTEETVTITTELGRSATARRISVYGNASLCFPAGLLCGTMPGAEQTDGCAISAGLSDALFGSRDTVGLQLTAAGKNDSVTGVMEGEGLFLVCPRTTFSDAGYSAASLSLKNAENPRGMVQNLLQSAGISEDDTMLLPTGTLRQLLSAVAWLPLALASVILLRRLWLLTFPEGTARRMAVFWLLMLAALALPGVLATLPRWLIPSRWSDLDFWAELVETAGQSLQAFVSLPDTARDHLLGGQILSSAACLMSMCLGALSLSLAHAGTHGKAGDEIPFAGKNSPPGI